MDTSQYLGGAAPDLAEDDLVEVVDALALHHGRQLLLLLGGRRRRGGRHVPSREQRRARPAEEQWRLEPAWREREAEQAGTVGLIGEFPDSAYSSRLSLLRWGP